MAVPTPAVVPALVPAPAPAPAVVPIHALVDALPAARPLGPVRLVCLDGPAGSGKTTLAARFAAVATAAGNTVAVVHMDDLYDGWSALVGPRATALTRLIEADLLHPLAVGHPGGYRRYDWPAAAFAEHHPVPVVDVLVLEGCGSAQRSWADRTALAVWVEVDRDLRTGRWLDRDDDTRAAEQCRDWQLDEDAWFAADGTRARADLVVDGAPPVPHDPTTELVRTAGAPPRSPEPTG